MENRYIKLLCKYLKYVGIEGGDDLVFRPSLKQSEYGFDDKDIFILESIKESSFTDVDEFAKRLKSFYEDDQFT